MLVTTSERFLDLFSSSWLTSEEILNCSLFAVKIRKAENLRIKRKHIFNNNKKKKRRRRKVDELEEEEKYSNTLITYRLIKSIYIYIW